MHKKIIAALGGIIFTGIANGGTLGDISTRPYERVITLSLGPSWTSSNKTQNFYLQPSVQKTYAANNTTKTLVSGELFVGWQRNLRPNLHGQLGLALAGATDARLSGDIWEDADPDFNNFTYHYKINHAHLALKGTLLSDSFQRWWCLIQPYISASAGIGLNNAHNFTINPKIFAEVPAPNFRSHTNAAFSYTLGLGVQRTWNDNIKAHIGYELADWGKSYLDAASGQTIGRGLQLNHLYTHTLQVGLSFIA